MCGARAAVLAQHAAETSSMKLRYKIGGSLVLLLALALLALGIALSYESECGPAPAYSGDSATMQAITYHCYGPPEVLELQALEKPAPAEDQVLVRVHAAAVNPLDWHYMRGSPYIMRLGTGLGAPKETRLGVDFAGTIEAVGNRVTRFKPGDEVFGGRTGAFAEYVTVREDRALALKPANVSFEQAAAVPIAAITALQGLRDKGRLQPGQKVLINGASGGVGTFAVQIAKALGAEVTGVCSSRNVDMVRALGADHVIDYTRENFTEGGQRYDLILDNVGNHSLRAIRRALVPDGTLVIVGGSSKGNWIGPMTEPLLAILSSPFVSQNLENFMARLDPQDLSALADLMRAGKVTPVIDRRYPLSEVPAAIRYLEEGHARGKVIITVP
jgi:NADPH:quinone reductase-like Zn-dependent oxidoreductase